VQKVLIVLLVISMVVWEPACLVPNRCPSQPCPSPSNEFNPSELLDGLRKQSQPFARFYDDKVAPLGYTIHWFHNTALPLGTARTCVNNDHSATIELGNVSPGDDVAFTIAHELAAIITASQGYKFVQYKARCETLGTYLSEMISTPLRDAILANCDLDATREFYTYRLPPLLHASCYETDELTGQLQNACLYVLLVLYWQDTLGNHEIPPNIDSIFERCFPHSREKGQHILAIIAETRGYDTAAKTTAILQRVIREHELEDCICVP